MPPPPGAVLPTHFGGTKGADNVVDGAEGPGGIRQGIRRPTAHLRRYVIHCRDAPVSARVSIDISDFVQVGRGTKAGRFVALDGTGIELLPFRHRAVRIVC